MEQIWNQVDDAMYQSIRYADEYTIGIWADCIENGDDDGLQDELINHMLEDSDVCGEATGQCTFIKYPSDALKLWTQDSDSIAFFSEVMGSEDPKTHKTYGEEFIEKFKDNWYDLERTSIDVDNMLRRYLVYDNIYDKNTFEGYKDIIMHKYTGADE